MEALQNSIQTMTDHFNTQMAEFQKSLQGVAPATSPTLNIAGQFTSFRVFVLSALAGLQKQVEILASQTDQMEMRNRRKMLLLHGIPEGNNQNLTATVSSSLASHLKLPNLQENCFSRCQRLGQLKGDKPRPILLKLRDVQTRNQVWFAKTALKNSGFTLSEFLTKDRHDAFMAARQKFGISKCWTREGRIIVIGCDGKRHCVTSRAEVNSLQTHSDAQVLASVEDASNPEVPPQIVRTGKHLVSEPVRSKRALRK